MATIQEKARIITEECKYAGPDIASEFNEYRPVIIIHGGQVQESEEQEKISAVAKELRRIASIQACPDPIKENLDNFTYLWKRNKGEEPKGVILTEDQRKLDCAQTASVTGKVVEYEVPGQKPIMFCPESIVLKTEFPFYRIVDQSSLETKAREIPAKAKKWFSGQKAKIERHLPWKRNKKK